MLSEIKKCPHFMKMPPLYWFVLDLPVSLRGFGFESFENDYGWNNKNRGPEQYILFKCTISGMGSLDYNNRTYKLPPFTAFIIPVPSVSSYCLPVSYGHWEFIHFSVMGDWINRQCRKYIQENGPILRLSDDSEVFMKAWKCLSHLLQHENMTPYEASNELYSFFTTLLDPHGTKVNITHTLPIMRKAMDFCHANFQSPINIDDLASHVNQSRSHLSREFKKYFQVAPGEYILNLRLQKAAEYLVSSNRLIKEIAHESGFNDFNYFCRIFRKRYKQSPGNFRENGG